MDNHKAQTQGREQHKTEERLSMDMHQQLKRVQNLERKSIIRKKEEI